jgi:hypothetical protein
MCKSAKTLLLIGAFAFLFCAPASAFVELPIEHDWTVTVLGYTFGIQSYPAYKSTPVCSVVYYGFGSFASWHSPYAVVTIIVAAPLLVFVGVAGFLAWRRRSHEKVA